MKKSAVRTRGRMAADSPMGLVDRAREGGDCRKAQGGAASGCPATLADSQRTGQPEAALACAAHHHSMPTPSSGIRT